MFVSRAPDTLWVSPILVIPKLSKSCMSAYLGKSHRTCNQSSKETLHTCRTSSYIRTVGIKAINYTTFFKYIAIHNLIFLDPPLYYTRRWKPWLGCLWESFTPKQWTLYQFIRRKWTTRWWYHLTVDSTDTNNRGSSSTQWYALSKRRSVDGSPYTSPANC